MTAVESVSVCRETNYCTLGSQAVPATSCHSFAHYYFHRIRSWKIIFRLCEQQGEPMTEPTKGGKRHMLVTLLFARQRSLSYYMAVSQLTVSVLSVSMCSSDLRTSPSVRFPSEHFRVAGKRFFDYGKRTGKRNDKR